MILEYKNTIYEPIFKLTNNQDGLKDSDYWINIHFKLKNDEINYNGVIKGMSFKELKKWNDTNKRFINNEMKDNENICFIRKLGELYYYPKENKVEKRLYLFNNTNKYYTIYFNIKEVKEIYNINKKFIEKNI